MNKTPRQVWDEAAKGQAFVTWWKGDDESIDADGTLWIKGSVSTLDWENLVWIAPVSLGERIYS